MQVDAHKVSSVMDYLTNRADLWGSRSVCQRQWWEALGHPRKPTWLPSFSYLRIRYRLMPTAEVLQWLPHYRLHSQWIWLRAQEAGEGLCLVATEKPRRLHIWIMAWFKQEIECDFYTLHMLWFTYLPWLNTYYTYYVTWKTWSLVNICVFFP